MKPKLFTKLDYISLILIIGAGALSFFFYSRFPEQVPVHWNIQGEPDGYGSRAMAAFMFPVFSLCIFLLLSALPFIDPNKERYIEFRRAFGIFKMSITAFLVLIYCIVGVSALGYPIRISFIVPIVTGFLFILLGNYMAKIKNNWFVGIRTPWTLSSEEVWNKTHRLGGMMFVLGGLLLIASAFISPVYAFTVLISVVIVAAVIPTIYSYMLYKKTHKM